ncbi:MAG: hypothetical protein NWE99_05355 [Candidatus Bathyarchaeota archaeon]|nr:hypothetical protein [Candidatus Bathyarchaeota archaeon]
MVNQRRIIKKLPALLCDGATSQRKFYNEFMRYRWRLMQLRKHNPQRFSSLTVELVAVLEKIDKELQEQNH